MASTRNVDGREVPVAGRWVFDHDHTVLGFVARHMVFTKVRGRFNEFDGAINIGERLEDSYVELDIDASSLTTEVADRDAHLRSSDFLEISEHPKIVFRSTAVDLDAMTLTGDLTIRGVTHPVTLAFTYEGIVPYPWGGDRAMFTAQSRGGSRRLERVVERGSRDRRVARLQGRGPRDRGPGDPGRGRI